MKRFFTICISLMFIISGIHLGFSQTALSQATTPRSNDSYHGSLNRTNPLSGSIAYMEGVKIIEFPSSIPYKVIHFEYKLGKNDAIRLRGVGSNGTPKNDDYIGITGVNTPLLDFILQGFFKDVETGNRYDNIDIEVEPALKNNVYQFYLKLPPFEPREKVLDSVCNTLGINYQTIETTVSAYSATWNGKKFSFPTTAPSNLEMQSTNQKTSSWNFFNNDMGGIFELYYMKYNVRIQDATGIKDKFSGYNYFPPTFEQTKQEMKENMGIDLQPINIKIKKLFFTLK